MVEQWNRDRGRVEQWNSDGGTVAQRWWNNDTEKWGTEMVEHWNSDGEKMKQ